MSRREDIDNAIWSDPDFEAVSPPAKLVYLWSFTNPRCGMAGLYKLAAPIACLEVGLSADEFEAALAELAGADLAYYEDKVLWVRSRVKHLRTRTPQIARSVAKDIEKIAAEHPLRIRFLETYGDYAWLAEQLAVLAPDEYGWRAPVTVSPKRRREVFDRDGHRCVKCGATEQLTIDHRKPRSHGGDNSLENLQTLCRGCNARKGPTSDLALESQKAEPLTRPSNGTSNRRFQGKGMGKGKGLEGGGPGEETIRRQNWMAWAQEHVPDLPAEFVAQVASSTPGDRSPQRIRERTLAAYPSLRQEDAA